MKTRNLFLTLAVVGAMLPLSARAAMMTDGPATEPQSTASASSDDALYAAGTKAMDEQRWPDAVSTFDKVAAAKGKHADAAIYWKAYSLNKLGKKDEAQATCDSLKQQMPSSSWNRECAVLRVNGSAADAREIANQMREEARDQAREATRMQVYSRTPHQTSEDDIKLLAINALMQQEPAKALPLLHDFVLSDKPIEVRRQALFIMSRNKDPQAQAMLLDVVNSTKDPALQLEAIQALAIYRPKDAGPTLVKVYQSTSDTKVKRAALNGLFIAHDATHLVELARAEKDLNLKRDIVSQLAIMHDPVATAYMEELLK